MEAREYTPGLICRVQRRGQFVPPGPLRMHSVSGETKGSSTIMRTRSGWWRGRVWGAVACGALAVPLLAAAPAGPAGRPAGPNVRPNVRMNAAQLPSPQGLLGRAAE